MSELKHCPFCGNIPEFGPIYDPDERRHMDMDLECCVTMTARISYPEYTAMNSFALKDALQAELTREWNRRTQPEATKPAQDLSAAILAIEYGADYADPCKQWAFDAGFKAALKAAAALASPADARVAGDSDTDLLNWLEQPDPQGRYYNYDHIGAEVNKGFSHSMHTPFVKELRAAIRAAIQVQKDGHG